MAPTTYREVSITMKRYKIGDRFYWYEEGTQPEGAIEDTKKTKEQPKVEVKAVAEVKNKAKGAKAK